MPMTPRNLFGHAAHHNNNGDNGNRFATAATPRPSVLNNVVTPETNQYLDTPAPAGANHNEEVWTQAWGYYGHHDRRQAEQPASATPACR